MQQTVQQNMQLYLVTVTSPLMKHPADLYVVATCFGAAVDMVGEKLMYEYQVKNIELITNEVTECFTDDEKLILPTYTLTQKTIDHGKTT